MDAPEVRNIMKITACGESLPEQGKVSGGRSMGE